MASRNYGNGENIKQASHESIKHKNRMFIYFACTVGVCFFVFAVIFGTRLYKNKQTKDAEYLENNIVWDKNGRHKMMSYEYYADHLDSVRASYYKTHMDEFDYTVINDHVIITMPATIQELLDCGFNVSNEYLDGDITLAPNDVIKNIPVSFTSFRADNMDCRLDVGTIYEDRSIPFKKARIKSLYLAKKHDSDVFEYNVIFPGYITFGQSYEDVVSSIGANNMVLFRDSTNKPVMAYRGFNYDFKQKDDDTWIITKTIPVKHESSVTEVSNDEYLDYKITYEDIMSRFKSAYDDYLSFLDDPQSSDFVLYSDDTVIYAVLRQGFLDPTDYLLLGFENNKLVSIQWYAYDLSMYTVLQRVSLIGASFESAR